MTDDAMLLSELLATEDLEEAQRQVDSWTGRESLREALIREFHRVVEYDDASEWCRAVRLCELLALVGWEPSERVDAFARFNGDCWQTGFYTDRNEPRYRHGRWTKRKAGWALFNPEYHFSPDRPEFPARDWKQHDRRKYAPVDVDQLPTQRNYLRRMPFSVSVVGRNEPDLARASDLRRELATHLTDAMVRHAYGDAVEHFYITLHQGTEPFLTLSIGAFRPKERAFSCDLDVPPGFSSLALKAQKAFFRDAFTGAIAALRTKLDDKKITFNIDAFTGDVGKAFDAWGLHESTD